MEAKVLDRLIKLRDKIKFYEKRIEETQIGSDRILQSYIADGYRRIIDELKDEIEFLKTF